MKQGDTVRLRKKTFMYNGIFILTNSLVEISSIIGKEVEVIYHDKEGYKHLIKNLSIEDVVPI
jgi:hypothetical protein